MPGFADDGKVGATKKFFSDRLQRLRGDRCTSADYADYTDSKTHTRSSTRISHALPRYTLVTLSKKINLRNRRNLRIGT